MASVLVQRCTFSPSVQLFSLCFVVPHLVSVAVVLAVVSRLALQAMEGLEMATETGLEYMDIENSATDVEVCAGSLAWFVSAWLEDAGATPPPELSHASIVADMVAYKAQQLARMVERYRLAK